MGKQAKIAYWFLVIFSLIAIVFFMYFAFAAHVVKTSTLATTFNLNEDRGDIFNISVNNTDALTGANITQVNITIPPSFTFMGVNGTDSLGVFTNATPVLSWLNITALVMNLTTNYFWVNLSASTPGIFNITVATTNASGTFYSNLSVVVNDTTPPSAIQFGTPTPSTGANLSQNSIPVNVTVTDNGIIDTIAIRLFNASNVLNSTNVSWGSATNFSYNFTGLVDGIYYINATANDTYGNANSTETRKITLDTTKPLIWFNDTGMAADGANTTLTNIYVNVSVTETNERNITFYLYNASGIIVNTTGYTTAVRFINWTSLADGLYKYNVTVLDQAGNLNDTATRTIRIDTTVPAVQFVSPTYGNNWVFTGTSISVNVTASDGGVGLKNITLRLFNSTRVQINVTNSSTSPLDISWGGLNNDTYYINATAIDTLGNTNSTETRTLILRTSSFEFNGTIKDENAIALNNSVVNLTVRSMAGWAVVGYVSTTTNASGWFNITVPNDATWIFAPSVIHRNTSVSGNPVDFISKTIPTFPSQMMTLLAGTTFYLAPAGTMNITAINSSGARISFNYQVKDTRLGYPVASEFTSQVSEAIVNVPKNRNYSIMVYPQRSMPVSFNWNNFSSTISYNITGAPYNPLTNNSRYDVTTSTLHKEFNTSMTWVNATGNFNLSNTIWNISNATWQSFTVVPYLVEPGNMIHAEFGDMPYNLRSIDGTGQNDSFALATGAFNIALPATAESSTIILFATGVTNITNISYGAFANLSLSYNAASRPINFTNVAGLFGSSSNISMDLVNGSTAKMNITTAKQRFYLANNASTNATIGNTSAHIEVTVNYGALGGGQFTWMTEIDQSSTLSFLDVILLNSTGVKEMNIFASGGGGGQGDNSQYAPKRVSLAASQILPNANVSLFVGNNNTIALGNFNPQDLDGQIGSGSLSIGLYISNSSCDVPNPASSCVLGSSAEQNFSSFNPMQAVMGGGKISFRMGYNNVSVHYVNVDLIASGPPDAMFESNKQEGLSGTFDSAMRFGSSGPNIYDYVLVSIPYTEGGTTTQTGLDESNTVNMSLKYLYDDSWNAVWNTTANGTSGTALSQNYSHYSIYASDWNVLLSVTNCTTTVSQLNATRPCFIDTTNNKIWVRLPHFTGSQPDIDGRLINYNSTTGGTSGGGGGGETSFWTSTFGYDDKDFSQKEPLTRELQQKHRVKIKLGSDSHYVGVISLTATTATINVSSMPQQATLSVGESKKFEVTNDTFYDLLVKLNGIANNKANFTISYLHEAKSAAPSTNQTTTGANETGGAPPTTPLPTTTTGGAESKVWLWLIIGIIVLAVLIVVIYFVLARKQR